MYKPIPTNQKMVNILREPTKEERKDMVILGEDSPNPSKRRNKIQPEFEAHIRYQIANAKKIEDVKVSCFGSCMLTAMNHELLSEDLKTAWEQLRGVEFQEVKISVNRFKDMNGKFIEYNVYDLLYKCPFCSHQTAFSVDPNKKELSPELDEICRTFSKGIKLSVLSMKGGET